MNPRPSFQFYPADWRKDSALQSCSIGARGLWIDLLCIMHECQPYGSLIINGQPLQVPQIARLVGETQKTLLPLLTELEGAGVFSRDDDGTIFSRRMRRDEYIRTIRAEAGRLGGNASHLLNQNQSKIQAKAKQTGKQSLTPSSSSSSKNKEYTLDFLAFYKSYPLKKARPKAFKAWLKVNPQNGLVEEIMTALETQKKSIDWQKNNGEYIPHPATWLNDRRWEDEIAAPAEDWR
jgi:hypothetical protein